MRIAKVKGENDIVRDRDTTAIVNTNHQSFLKAKARKKEKLDQQERLSIVENRVEMMDKKIDAILELLQKDN